MRVPITVNYVPDGDDWTVTVAVAGEDATHSARAAGLIAARDQADQMVDRIAPDDDARRVVHLLDGDAYAFTTTYLHARLGLTEPPEPLEPSPMTPPRPVEPPTEPGRISTDQVIAEPADTAPDWPDSTVETAGPAGPDG